MQGARVVVGREKDFFSSSQNHPGLCLALSLSPFLAQMIGCESVQINSDK